MTLKKIKLELSGGNRKCTYLDIQCVSKAKISEFNGKRYLWPNGNGYYKHVNVTEDGRHSRTVVIETDSPFLYIKYETGSWKNVYESFTGLYDVEKEKWIMKIGETKEEGKELYEQLKKEMIEEGFAISNSKPVTNAIAYYLYKNAANEEEKKLEKAKNMMQEIINLVGKEKALEILNSL